MRRKGSGKDDPGSTARQQLVISEGLANRDLTLQSLCARADAGDDIAHDAIVRGGAYLGVGLASLANVMNPGVIVVGGGVLGAGTRWFDAVRRTVLERVRHTIAAGLDVVPAELGSDAVVIGAGLMALG
jgi:glucokinase